ncbi:hypothetical protein MKW94_029991 [Papaver nudicaule]|uniref:Uncharacterized protein n=1 Tax=Papaver nudicaule TaxID=74823 RepID=A0AA41VI14_PAPNU|nr:hypothetical protein [Papaver nudicaule]
MVCCGGSVSILSPTTSSFPANSNNDSSSFLTSSSFTCNIHSNSNRLLKISRNKKQIFCKIQASSSNLVVEDGEKFVGNNSIADFMRFRKGNEKSSGELQTAVVTYRKKFPWSLLKPFLQVDLVSTIHIGDKEYFEALQKDLESYDCVLYEMVTSRENLENKRNPAATKRLAGRSRGFNIIGCIQRQMARILTLDFQLDCLNYDARNWYHADLDIETFKLLQLERGESFFTFARDMTVKSTKAFVQAAAVPKGLDPVRSKLLWASRVLPMPLVGLLLIGGVCYDAGDEASDYPELEALSRLDIGGALKIFLAKRLTSEFSQVTSDLEESSVIIGERNRVATLALQRAIDDGCNKIAILYGGGHMPDLGRRLREDFDMVPSQVEWVTAWSIRNKELESEAFPFLKTLAEVTGWPLNRYQTLALLIFSSVLAVDLWFWELFFGTTVDWISHSVSEISQFLEHSKLL